MRLGFYVREGLPTEPTFGEDLSTGPGGVCSGRGNSEHQDLGLVWRDTLGFLPKIPGCFKSLLKCHFLSDVTSL